jgi:hypothetical protein
LLSTDGLFEIVSCMSDPEHGASRESGYVSGPMT